MEDLAMRTTYDFAPLWRSTVGFDRLFDLAEAAQHGGTEDNYPPCNVERLSEDRYQISLAVAGFSPDEIAITAEQSVLTVEGQKAEKHQREFLYQGISSRLSVPKTLSELMTWWNRLSWWNDRTVPFRPGRPGLAIQVEGAA
jgi:molecular chaperone IbpA